MYRFILISSALALVLTACGGKTASDSPASDPAILASTTFLADITRNIAGNQLTVDRSYPLAQIHIRISQRRRM